jgi:hypothetical protein
VSYLPGPWIYLTATPLALLSPALSALLYAAIAAYNVESSLVGRERPSRGAPKREEVHA